MGGDLPFWHAVFWFDRYASQHDDAAAISNTVAEQTRYFNWLHGFYGIGATCLPLVSVWILQYATDWRSGFWFGLAMLGLIMLLVLPLRYAGIAQQAESHTHHPVKPAQQLYTPLLFGLLAAILSLAVAFAGGHGAAVFFFVAGIGFSAVFPTIAAIACDIYAEHAGKVLGLLFTASGIGSMLANWLIGLTATSFGLHAGFSLIFLFLFADLLCMLGIIRYRRQKQNLDNQVSF